MFLDAVERRYPEDLEIMAIHTPLLYFNGRVREYTNSQSAQKFPAILSGSGVWNGWRAGW